MTKEKMLLNILYFSIYIIELHFIPKKKSLNILELGSGDKYVLQRSLHSSFFGIMFNINLVFS